MNRDDLQKIIDSADFNKLIGEIENGLFDCKGEIYQLTDDAGKRELAKDVSSFANAEGGFIFIGAKTVQSSQNFGDEVKSLHPFERVLLNTTQYRDVIREWVYPEITDVDIRWIPVTNGLQKGLAVIVIPIQKESIKPFIIKRVIDNKRRVEVMFGYAQRKGDVSQPLTVVDLQRTLRSGFHYEGQLKERLDGIESLLRDTTQQKQVESQKTTFKELIEERIKRSIEYNAMKDDRTFTISAYPDQQCQLKSIFLSSENSIRKRLENPPIIRPTGWSLETLDQAQIMRAEMIRVANGNRKVIDLYKDGSLVFTGLAGRRFLGWGADQGQKINPLALIELIYNFVNFYKLVLDDCDKLPSSFTVRLDFRNFYLNGVKSYLSPYKIGTFAQMYDDEAKDAPTDQDMIEMKILVESLNVPVVAFQIAKEVYLWFGIEEDKIPYVKIENGIKMIDVEEIKGRNKTNG